MGLLMKEGAKTVFGVFLLFVLVGCAGQEAQVTEKAFVGGTQGLEITFLPGRPPQDVFDDPSFKFQIGAKLENKGEWDILNANDIEVSVTGINPSSFNVQPSSLIKKADDPLNGVKINAAGDIVKGDITNVEFPEMNYVTPVSGTLTFSVLANVCYEYGTKLQGKLCVRKDLRRLTTQDGLCNPDRNIPFETSGAPIQITNVKQSVSGTDKIDIAFTIRKSGASTDSLHKAGTTCDSVQLSNRDVVYVNVKDTGLGEMKCSGLSGGTATAGYVTLFNGEREMRCSQTISSPIDFETPFNIELKYGYKQFVETKINVKHSS